MSMLHHFGITIGRIGQPILVVGAGALGKAVQSYYEKDKDKSYDVTGFNEDDKKGVATVLRKHAVSERELPRVADRCVQSGVRSPAGTARATEAPTDVVQVEDGIKSFDECSCARIKTPITRKGSEDAGHSGSRLEREFEILETLGNGGFGSVHKVRSKLDDSQSAVKSIVLDSLNEQVLREVRILAKLRNHPNVVQYHGCWYEPLTPHLATIIGYDATPSSPPGTSSPTSLSHYSSSCASSSSHSDMKRVDVMEQGGGTGQGAWVGSSGDSIDNKMVLFVQMELCETQTLADWLQQSKQSNHDEGPQARRTFLLRTFRQLFDATDHMHQQGFIHRDIKPANVFFVDSSQSLMTVASASASGSLFSLLPAVPAIPFPDHTQSVGSSSSKEGKGGKGSKNNSNTQQLSAKLGDFGLACIDHSQHFPGCPSRDAAGCANSWSSLVKDKLEMITQGVGTAVYAAPEQLSRKTYSRHADIYSLGIMLAEAFCGPFGTAMERLVTLQAVRDGVLPSAFVNNEPGLASLVRRMTSKEPLNRPEAAQLRRELLEYTSALQSPLVASLYHHPGLPFAMRQDYPSASANGNCNSYSAPVSVKGAPVTSQNTGWSSAPNSNTRGMGSAEASLRATVEQQRKLIEALVRLIPVEQVSRDLLQHVGDLDCSTQRTIAELEA